MSAAADAELNDDVPEGADAIAAEDSAEALDQPTEQSADDEVSDLLVQSDAAAAETVLAGTVSAEAVDIAELTAQLEAANAQRDDYLQQLQRKQAEFQNYRRRVETERRQQVAVGVSRLVESLLPVLDGCDAAAAHDHSEVAAVGQALMVALGKAGLERIDAVGEEFDPTQHEAVIVEGGENGGAALAEPPTDEADPAKADAGNRHGSQIVVEELRSGYRFDGRVLRAAMVKVRTG